MASLSKYLSSRLKTKNKTKQKNFGKCYLKLSQKSLTNPDCSSEVTQPSAWLLGCGMDVY